MSERLRTLRALGTGLFCAAVLVATAGASDVKRIPASGGEVIHPTKDDEANYKEYSFAAVRRVGDTLYLSGLIVNRRKGEGNDEATF